MPTTLSIAEIDGERRRALEQQFPKVRVVPSPAWAVADADVVIVAVKPGDVAATPARPRSRRCGAETLVLSIAAGVTIATLEALVPGRPVVRAMPNTPALVGLGASAIAAGTPRRRRPPRSRRAPARRGRHRRDASASPLLDAVTGLVGLGSRRTCSSSRKR